MSIGRQKLHDLTVLACGGREYTDRHKVFRALDFLHESRRIKKVIAGAARGADTLAIEWAKSRGVSWEEFPADWDREGIAAGPIRNQRMIDQGNPDVVVAFPGGRGTEDMRNRAARNNLPIWEPYA